MNKSINIKMLEVWFATGSQHLYGHNKNCIGIITWMHTFSPAKMWINGLKILQKPLLHLHTQFNRDIPWGEIDMDFMNLNQSAHGDREFGFMMTRMRMNRKVITGHWQNKEVVHQIAGWTRAALGWNGHVRQRAGMTGRVQSLFALAITCVM